ncbi:MAG TPA: FMN-binding protein [Micromonosporaceae bacterium]|nr:FMN-binding protein [Micromonosporaceae bacterium]
MRRSVAFVLGTLTGTSLLVGAKFGTHAHGSAAGGDSAAAAVVAGGAVVTGGSKAPAPTASGHPAKPGASVTPGGRPSGTPTGTTPAPGHTTSKPTPKPTPTPTPTQTGPADGTYKASASVDGGHYGTLSMTVTISGHRITAVSASESNPTESKCYRSACPKLTSEALSAQSAKIAAVSGATYTSSAYKSALQAVLNAA